jgi:hypothetical protein
MRDIQACERFSSCSGGVRSGGRHVGEKAVQAARARDLPAQLLKEIDAARKYVEGRGIRLAVRNAKTLGTVKKLAAIKLAN